MSKLVLRAGKYVWGRVDDWGMVTEYVTAESMPAGDGWFAHYPARRVRGDTYEHYYGPSDWEVAANAAMASAANTAFRRQGSH